MDISTWALPQLERLLPLDQESLKQIVSYSESLSPNEAADHLKNLLGDSAQALEFISAFNSRRAPPPSQAGARQESEVPKPKPRQKKGKGNIHQLPPRRVEHAGNVSGGYLKKDEDDYMSGSSKSSRKEDAVANALQLQEKPDAIKLPKATNTPSSTNPRISKPPPSASGPLISDSLPSSKNNSRTASPAPKAKAKVNISGGTSMKGQSSVVNDLDSAIRALEIQTNPSLASNTAEDNAKRRCNCMATRHPLLEAAPNCLNCGKIICVKEGLGPCTFCEKPLLSQADIQSMVKILREERGREKMEANNATQRRAEVSKAARPFSGKTFLASPGASAPSSDSEAEGLRKAQEHRDRLLGFQANNARRTRIHDDAADFDTPVMGTNMWASPQERALQLKRQQKVLREQEWAMRPEYEKRQMVASIDLAGGKVVRRMQAVQRPESPETEDDLDEPDFPQESAGPPGGKAGGAFSRNPLLGGLIRPVAKVSEDKGKEKERERKSTWRRVQDDLDDNEQWILDGGAYGGKTEGRVLGAEEHASGP
ncbi:C2HC5 finger protein [Phyllosticta capitalensis]|uniref:C2HC5 finger protein n=1 Tax=Phyllosticta capitalensis TaxID=121624 RepID=A0ABR1YVG4_9PEZI